MVIGDIEAILADLRDTTYRLIQAGKREEILNDRFFHHMFSHKVSSLYEARGEDIWERLGLIPECPTDKRFRRIHIDPNDEETTRQNAIGVGKAGNLDFVLKTSPVICVEWKGPILYQPLDVIEVFLKLLTQERDATKVFAAIITSSITGRRDHMEKAERYFQESLSYVKRVLRIPSVSNQNLYAYVVTIPNGGPVPIRWGKIDE